MRVEQRRAQVAEQAQLRTDFQQAHFRTQRTVEVVPLRTADGAEQDSVGGAGALQGLVGQRSAVLLVGRAAQLVVAQLEAQLVLLVGQLQHLDCFGDDFRTDTITREHQNLLAHCMSL
ncbi:hypothetical protein D9M71_597320 [compost metagenome]